MTPTLKLAVIKDDPDDDRILECAMAAKSDYIVTDGKDLLRLGRFGGVEIVNIADFAKKLTKGQGVRPLPSISTRQRQAWQ